MVVKQNLLEKLDFRSVLDHFNGT